MDYVIEKAGQSDLPEILSFIRENFEQEETMLKSMREKNPLTENELELIWLDQERFLRDVFEDSPCLIAIHEKSKKIIGINYMLLSERPAPNSSEIGVSAALNKTVPKTALVKEYVDYLTEIGEKAGLYDKFPNATAALEFYAIAVDKEHRGKGLAKALTSRGVSYAKTLKDIGFVFGIYTSIYSRKAAERAGLKSYMDVDLLTYKDDKGQPIFQDTKPHNIVSVMALEI